MNSSSEVTQHSIYHHTVLFRCYGRQDPFTWTILLEKMERSYCIVKISKRKKQNNNGSSLYCLSLKRQWISWKEVSTC